MCKFMLITLILFNLDVNVTKKPLYDKYLLELLNGIKIVNVHPYIIDYMPKNSVLPRISLSCKLSKIIYLKNIFYII